MVLFLGTPSSDEIRDAMVQGWIGCMITPAQGMGYPVGCAWAADNGNGPKQDGTFVDQYTEQQIREQVDAAVGSYFTLPAPETLAAIRNAGPYERYLAFLADAVAREGGDPCDPDTSGCLFATAPDLYCDAAGTLQRAEVPYRMLALIREVIGIPAALVTQDGMRPQDLPFGDFDVLFMGGSKRWKASDDARDLLRAADRHGLAKHLGMVNTKQWLRFAANEGYDTCDGTTLTRGPDKNLAKMLRWLPEIWGQPALF